MVPVEQSVSVEIGLLKSNKKTWNKNPMMSLIICFITAEEKSADHW